MMTKAELKKWLDEDGTNRLFVRRIGIPQYKLIGITDVEELKSIKKELDSTIRSLKYMQDLRTMKDSAWMKDLYSRTYTTRFFSDNWRLVTKVREGQIDVNPMNDLLCWRLTLQKYFGHDKSWWEASHDIGSFYKNVRYYLRDKVADQIIRENKVYTISRNLNYIMSVGSKFDVRWRRERILAGTPLFFIEKDYAGRMIFMAGTQTFALSIAQALSVRELKEEKE